MLNFNIFIYFLSEQIDNNQVFSIKLPKVQKYQLKSTNFEIFDNFNQLLIIVYLYYHAK